MAVFMLGAGLSDYIADDHTRNGITACFLFREYPITFAEKVRELTNAPAVFAVAYYTGLGPIPFTLASESFPLTHREAVGGLSISRTQSSQLSDADSIT
jgi:hypothetical protein